MFCVCAMCMIDFLCMGADFLCVSCVVYVCTDVLCGCRVWYMCVLMCFVGGLYVQTDV